MAEKTDETSPHGTEELVRVEAFDPAEVRPWKFHNRRGSGMDDESLNSLASSIVRDGQQQHGLARRLPPGDSHSVAADVLRAQQDGWELAMVHAIDSAEADGGEAG